MELQVIAYAKNGHTDKFGIPRQSRDESPILTRIVFEPEYNVAEALRGIDGYSHLWIIWGFSKVQEKTNSQDTKDWTPTVRPPRLGGNKRMGVFATRSPYRPNPIGLSSVRLVKKVLMDNSKGTGKGRIELLVSGADLLDGTPIYDIKPYLSFSDCHADAVNGFAEDTKDYQLDVDWSEALKESQIRHSDGMNTIDTRIIQDITYILRQDPRPGYQNDSNRLYKLDYGGWRIHFTIQKEIVSVKKAEKIENAK